MLLCSVLFSSFRRALIAGVWVILVTDVVCQLSPGSKAEVRVCYTPFVAHFRKLAHFVEFFHFFSRIDEASRAL